MSVHFLFFSSAPEDCRESIDFIENEIAARHQFWFSGAPGFAHAAFFDCRERLYCFSNETLNGKDYSYAAPFYAEEKPLLTVDEFGTDIITQECVGYLGSDRNPPGLSFEPVLEYVLL